jgi:hypothetical protein
MIGQGQHGGLHYLGECIGDVTQCGKIPFGVERGGGLEGEGYAVNVESRDGINDFEEFGIECGSIFVGGSFDLVGSNKSDIELTTQNTRHDSFLIGSKDQLFGVCKKWTNKECWKTCWNTGILGSILPSNDCGLTINIIHSHLLHFQKLHLPRPQATNTGRRNNLVLQIPNVLDLVIVRSSHNDTPKQLEVVDIATDFTPGGLRNQTAGRVFTLDATKGGRIDVNKIDDSSGGIGIGGSKIEGFHFEAKGRIEALSRRGSQVVAEGRVEFFVGCLVASNAQDTRANDGGMAYGEGEDATLGTVFVQIVEHTTSVGQGISRRTRLTNMGGRKSRCGRVGAALAAVVDDPNVSGVHQHPTHKKEDPEEQQRRPHGGSSNID